jgi:hypothetical protein
MIHGRCGLFVISAVDTNRLGNTSSVGIRDGTGIPRAALSCGRLHDLDASARPVLRKNPRSLNEVQLLAASVAALPRQRRIPKSDCRMVRFPALRHIPGPAA